MIFQMLRSDRQTLIIDRLYGAIVAQARRPSFYADYGVPDTVEGRFDMIVLHVALAFRRMRAEDSALNKLGQDVFDRFCRDMDHNLREMGVSDLAIPKRMRKMGGAFYGRAAAYEQALAASDEAGLVAAIARNVFAVDPAVPPAGAVRLARYVRRAAECLAVQGGAAIGRGVLDFPDPATI